MDAVQGGFMRGIIYKNTHNFSRRQLEELFFSVKFKEAEFADKLVISVKHSDTVFSAWHDDRLVAIVCALDDGIMNAHIQYILVHPDYQLKGIGKELLKRVQSHYQDYLNITASSPDSLLKFFEYSGFDKIDNTTEVFKNGSL